MGLYPVLGCEDYKGHSVKASTVMLFQIGDGLNGTELAQEIRYGGGEDLSALNH